MIEPIVTPEEKKRRELLVKTAQIQRVNLRKHLDLRLEKALSQGNKELICQLKEELKFLN